MKKFVQLSGYDNQWFWLVSSLEDLETGFVDQRNLAMRETVKRQLYDDPDRTTIKSDWLERVHLTQHNSIDYHSQFQKGGRPLLIRFIGSFMFLENYHRIIAVRYSGRFPKEKDNAEIVICENDAEADQSWLKFLKSEYPEKSIELLNLFSIRPPSDLDVDLDAPLITFKTTFSQYDWFEAILDCIIRNKRTGRSIVGYCGDSDKWKFPAFIQGKVDAVIQLGNHLKIIERL